MSLNLLGGLEAQRISLMRESKHERCNAFPEEKKMAEENAVVGEETALETEIIVLSVRGLEVCVDTNMKIHARMAEC